MSGSTWYIFLISYVYLPNNSILYMNYDYANLLLTLWWITELFFMSGFSRNIATSQTNIYTIFVWIAYYYWRSSLHIAHIADIWGTYKQIKWISEVTKSLIEQMIKIPIIIDSAQKCTLIDGNICFNSCLGKWWTLFCICFVNFKFPKLANTNKYVLF